MGSKYTIEEVLQIVECEGLGYAVQFCMGGDDISDPRLAKLWNEAQNALAKIEKILSSPPGDAKK